MMEENSSSLSPPRRTFNNSDYEWISHDIQVQGTDGRFVDAILFRGIRNEARGRIVVWYESTDEYEGLQGKPYTLDAPKDRLYTGECGVLRDGDGDEIKTRPRAKKRGGKRRRLRGGAAFDVRTEVCRLQGGTGKHIDGNVRNPLEGRPFQALVALTDSKPMDGSLRVLPGFHGVAETYFEGRNADVPRGGYTPLQPDLDEECLKEDLWCTAKRISKRWIESWKKGKLNKNLDQKRPRTRQGIVKFLKSLHRELQSFDDGDEGLVRTGDYVLWDTRLAHSTGERNTFSASENLRQAFYCSFVLGSEDESGLHRRMIQSCREMSTTPEWAPSSSYSPFIDGFETEIIKTSIGRSLYGYRDRDGIRGRKVTGVAALKNTKEEEKEVVKNLASEAHVAFFRRYGFVVIPSIIKKDLAIELRDAVRKEMKDRCEIDVTSLKTLQETLTFDKLRRAYSPDGAAMVEMYWHPLMETIRQNPVVSGTFRYLLRGTWGRGGGAYRRRKPVGDDENEALLVYIDRTNLKLPGLALETLIIQETSIVAAASAPI